MTCTTVAPGVVVCHLPYVRAAKWCSTCARVRPMAGTFGLNYGWHLTCIGCGDSYDSESCGIRPETGEYVAYRDERPFQRGWQAKRIATALRMWRNAMPLALEERRQIDEWRADFVDVPTGDVR